MFKSAKELKKETDEVFNEALEKEIKRLVEVFTSKTAQAKRDGEYEIFLTIDTHSDLELIAMKIIRKKLKEKGYKCGFIRLRERWSYDYYEMKVSWKKIK